MFGQPHFHARAVRRAAFATAQRRRQRPAGIENEQIAFPKVIVDLIEMGVFDLSRRTIDHEQAHLIAANSATLWRLFRA